MTPELTRLLELWRASTFRDFSGAQLELRVPLNEAVLNQLLEQLVLPRVSQLRGAAITVRAGNRIDVRVAASFARWLPPLTVPLDIHPDVIFAPGPIVRVDIRRGSLASEMSLLAGLFSSRLPRGVRLLDRRLEIHLAELAADGDARLVLGWLREGRISTHEGVLWLSLALSIA